MRLTNLSLKLIPSALLMFTVSTSCKKTQYVAINPVVTPASIYKTLKNSAGYSFMTAGITLAGLQDSLDSGGPYTLLAVQDDDFKRYYGLNSLADFQKLPNDSITAIIKYHVFKGRFPLSEIPAGPDSAKMSVAGLPVFFTHSKLPNGSEYAYANGLSLLSADFPATNGLIHSLNGALNPPLFDIDRLVASRPDLSLFRAIVARFPNRSLSQVRKVLGVFNFADLTLFAPNNQALINAGYATLSDINSADRSVLFNILRYHIVPGKNFSADFAEGQQLSTFLKQDIQIGFSTTNTTTGPQTTIKVKGSGDLQPASVTVGNRVGVKCVMFVIDKVLTPGQ